MNSTMTHTEPLEQIAPSLDRTLGWSKRYARPEARWFSNTAAVLKQHQDDWNRDAKNVAMGEAAAARRAEEKRQAQAAAAAKQEAERAERDERFVAELRERYMAADPGATEADFAQALPEIRRKHRIDVTLGVAKTADDAARTANARRYG